MRAPLPALMLAALIAGVALPFPSSAGAVPAVATNPGASAIVELTAAPYASAVAAARESQEVRAPQAGSSGQSDRPAYEEEGPSLGGLLLRAAAALALMTLLALATAILAKRYMPGLRGFSAYGASRVQLLESRRVTSRLTLFVVEFDGRRLLLAQSGDRIVEIGVAARDGQSAGA